MKNENKPQLTGKPASLNNNDSYSTAHIKQFRRAVIAMSVFPVLIIAMSAGVFYGSLNNNDTQAAPLVFSAGYETGNFNQWAGCHFHNPSGGTNYNCGQGGYSQQIVTSPVREGSYAAKYELRDGDIAISNERSEVQTASSDIKATEGSEMWYAWSTQFSSTFPATHSWGAVSQFKANGGSSPPMGLYVDHGNNQFGLTINKYSNGSSFSTNQVWSTSTTRNVWHDIKLHIKWSATDSGYVELWHNGVKQTFKGICAGQTRCNVRNMIPGVGGGNYYKQGYYRCECVAGTGIVYHDGFRAAFSEADLGAPYSINILPPTTPTTPPPPPPPTPAPTPAPPTSTTQSSYGGLARAIPGKIEAEDFDEGGEGVAYHDTSTTNDGAKYRTTGVDIQSSTDGGYNVGWNPAGEWREYTINAQAGTYNITARVSSAVSGAQLVIKLDGQNLGTINVPNTGGWQSYQTVALNNVVIPGGNNKVLRFETAGNDYTINWVNFALNSSTTPTTPTPPAPNPTPTPTPTNNPSVPEVVVTRPPESVPLVVIPGSNSSKPVQIPKDVISNPDGQLIGDFDGDGLNDLAFDLNSDGSINPGEEIVINGSDEPMLTDSDAQPEYAGMAGEGSDGNLINPANTITINSGPFKDAQIPKPVAYTFVTAQIFALSGLASYMAITKMALFAGLRGRLGL